MFARMRILVVDDNSVFREEVAEMLRDDGHDAEVAPSVAHAVDRLESERFDLVLTDLKMPRQTGLDLLRIVRERWPGLMTIMITGRAGIDSAVEAMRLGAFDYLAKPFRPDQLREVLKLAQAEKTFLRVREGARRTQDVVGELAADGHPVLLVTATEGAAVSKVTRFVSDGSDLAQVGDAVTAFVATHPGGRVVLPEVDRMLDHHRLPDVQSFLQSVQALLGEDGSLILGFDPAKVSEATATALRALVAASAVHGALEAVANPIRRRVLVRLEQGPASFTEVMRAAGLDDSPKMSFHVHRLVEAGLIARSEEEYRLTPAGTDATAAIHRMETASASQGTRGFVFLAAPPEDPAPPEGPPRRRS
jgi:CheY-like chemotaxis protein/predicted transcriptional regulator